MRKEKGEKKIDWSIHQKKYDSPISRLVDSPKKYYFCMNLNERSVKINALTEQSDVFTNLIGN